MIMIPNLWNMKNNANMEVKLFCVPLDKYSESDDYLFWGVNNSCSYSSINSKSGQNQIFY